MKIYLGYGTRVLLILIAIITLTLVGTYSLFLSVISLKNTEIKYSEVNNSNYKVVYKDNKIVPDKELESGLNYIPKLINTINIDYEYLLKIDKYIEGSYYYEVTSTINIVNKKTKELLYTKEYNEYVSNSNNLLKSKLYIKDTVEISYDKYYEIAEPLLKTYGNDAEANLIVRFDVNKNLLTDDYLENTINNVSMSSVSIPLEKNNSIKIINNNSEIDNSLYKTNELKNSDKRNIMMSILMYIASIYYIIKLIKLVNKAKTKLNKYDKRLRYIKTRYNKVIVDIDTLPDFSEYKVTKISKFSELLDVRNSYKDPIRFFEISAHNKCEFFIIHKNEVFIYTLKEVDLENEKKN